MQMRSKKICKKHKYFRQVFLFSFRLLHQPPARCLFTYKYTDTRCKLASCNIDMTEVKTLGNSWFTADTDGRWMLV